jgi:hypothetical protein
MAAKHAFGAVVALLVALGAIPRPAAAPEIAIRARTQLSFDGVRRTIDGGYLAVGQLRDRLTGDPLGNQQVVVTVGGVAYPTLTDPDGRFQLQLPPAAGPQDIALAFEGSATMDAADLTVEDVEVNKQPLELKLAAVPLSSSGVQVQVTASSMGVLVNVRTAIHAGPADAEPATLPKVGEITTGGASGSTLNLTRALAGGAGRRRIRAVFPGDDMYAAAQTDLTLELSTGTTTTFDLARKRVAHEDRIAGTGKVVDEDGKGVARVPVTLLAGDRRLEETSTRADGSFGFSLEAKLLGQGTFGLQAVVETRSPFLSPSRSDPVVVEIAAPQPVPIAFTLAAFAATALVAGGFFLARSRPWDRRKKQPLPADRPAAADDRGEVKGGLVQAKPSLVSTLRRASDLGVSGTVRDAARGRPVAGATVRLRLDGGGGDIAAEFSAVTADDGSFAFETLSIGEWRAKVSARGHVTERFGLTLPHRGELRGVRVDLVPVREQVFTLYKVVAQPVLPEGRLWGVWSPRQIVDHVRRQRPSPALSQLTDFVEEAYFSARVPDEDILPAAQDHVDRAVRERGSRPGLV